jgi:hypothetical protein
VRETWKIQVLDGHAVMPSEPHFPINLIINLLQTFRYPTAIDLLP